MTDSIDVHIRWLAHGQGLDVPQLATPGSAGADLQAALGPDGLELAPGTRALVPTGFEMALPMGYEGQIRPRSGLALRQGITVLNSPGTIDSDYRGEVKVLLINLGSEPVTLTRGMRVAQMVVAPVSQPVFHVAAQLEDTARGAGGFGSTGVAATPAPAAETP